MDTHIVYTIIDSRAGCVFINSVCVGSIVERASVITMINRACAMIACEQNYRGPNIPQHTYRHTHTSIYYIIIIITTFV